MDDALRYWQNSEFSDVRNRHRRSRGTLLQLSDVRLGIVLRRSEQPVLGPPDAGRFNPVNRRRDSFHRVALATLEHAVLESSDAGFYTLQIHAFPTGRAARTFDPQRCGNPVARMDALRVIFSSTFGSLP
jgi:hypothetical protein